MQSWRSVVFVVVVIVVGFGLGWYAAGPGGRDHDDGRIRNPDPADHLREVETIARAEAEIDGAAGGVIELENGTRVELPPGALGRSGTVTVLQRRADEERNGLIGALEYVEVQVPEGAEQLDAPAQISVSLPRMHRAAQTGEVVIHHITKDGRREIIEDVAVEGGMASFETRSFSYFLVMLQAQIYLAMADEAVKGDHSVIHEVPFYYQDDYQWCWATSAAMCFASQGTPVQPHRIAEIYDALMEYGGMFLPISVPNQVSFSFAEIAKKVGASGREEDYKQWAFGGVSEQSVRGWIIFQLYQGRVVWAGLREYKENGEGDHAVVVVGYDSRGFYVHDPSGALIKEVYARRKKRPGPGGQNLGAVNENALGYFHVRFGEWAEINQASGWFPRPWVESFAVIDRPLPPRRNLATLQIRPDFGPSYLAFARDTIRFSDIRDRAFFWNGVVDGGCGFSQLGVSDEDRSKERLSNSDGVSILNPVVHNMDDLPFSGKIRLLINGEKAAVDFPVVGVPPRTTNHLVTVVPERTLFNRTDDAWRPAPYPSPRDRASLPISDSLDFVRNPLPPGRYTISILLMKAGNVEIDRIDIPVEIDPAVVRNIRAEKVTMDDGRIGHRVTFEPSPEAGRSRGQPVYRIHRGRPGSKATRVVATLRAPKEFAATIPFPDGADEGTTFVYNVTYEHPETRRISPLGFSLDQVDGKGAEKREKPRATAATFVLRGVQLSENNRSRKAVEIQERYEHAFQVGAGGFNTVAGRGQVELQVPRRLEFREFRPGEGRRKPGHAMGLARSVRFGFRGAIQVGQPKANTSLGMKAEFTAKTLANRDYTKHGRESHVLRDGERIDPFKRNSGTSAMRGGHAASQLQRWYAATYGGSVGAAASIFDTDGFFMAEKRVRQAGSTGLNESFELELPAGSEVFEVRTRNGVSEMTWEVEVMTSYDPLPRPGLPRTAMLPEPNGFGSLKARLTYRLER